MIYTNISQRKKDFTIARLNRQLEHYEKIINALENKQVQEIFIKWQGKQYNKRMETSLNKLYNFFRVNKSVGLYLEFAFYNDRCITMENYPNNYGSYEVTYIDGKYGCTCLSVNSLFDEKTVREDLNETMQKLKEHYKREYENLKEQLNNIDNIISKFEELKKVINEFDETLNYSIKRELGISI